MSEAAELQEAQEPHPTVYLVEPNPFMAEVTRAILRTFEVRTIPPAELVGAALSEPPCLIITEILLSGVDGLQLCRELRARRETRDIPVLVFSILQASEEAIDAGADAFLLKPVGRSALLDEVRRLASRPVEAGED